MRDFPEYDLDLDVEDIPSAVFKAEWMEGLKKGALVAGGVVAAPFIKKIVDGVLPATMDKELWGNVIVAGLGAIVFGMGYQQQNEMLSQLSLGIIARGVTGIIEKYIQV